MTAPARTEATTPPLLSIVIPVYNEERRLPTTLAALHAFLTARADTAEIIVVDDGSSDQTVAIARVAAPAVRTLVRPHRGKGAAVRDGVLATKGRFVLITDADLATPLVELDRLMAALDGTEGVTTRCTVA
jgi:dolichyl-phosphate beta-glucosyltransferase